MLVLCRLCVNVSICFFLQCEPNLLVYPVYYDSGAAHAYRLALFSRQDIKFNEELTFDYTIDENGGFFEIFLYCLYAESDKKNLEWMKNECRVPHFREQRAIVPTELQEMDVKLEQRCKCGAPKCRITYYRYGHK